MLNAEFYIKKLNLEKHPEGGYFKETYRADKIIPVECLPNIYKGKRNYSTTIYFLLNKTDKSKFHILNSDEIWHFYTGSSIKLYMISKNGDLNIKTLGNDFNNKESFQIVIPAQTYFAAELTDKTYFALVGCTVAPGFDFQDFFMPKKVLTKLFPQHSDLINRF